MAHVIHFLVLLCLHLLTYSTADDKRRRHNRQQTVDYSQKNTKSENAGSSQTNEQHNSGKETFVNIESEELVQNITTEVISSPHVVEILKTNNEVNKEEKSLKDVVTSLKVKKCSVQKDQIKFAVKSYWNHDYVNAFVCARDMANVKSSRVNGVIQSILYNIVQMEALNGISFADISLISGIDFLTEYSLNKLDSFPKLHQWEVVGPIPVSKLEVDGDPTFHRFHGSKYTDIIEYILAMSTESAIYSEHVENGIVHWQAMSANMRTGQVEVNYQDVNWQSLYQNLGTSSSVEMQGWARTTSYVTKTTMYKIHCLGTHTVYIRNDNITRLVIGDIYRNPDDPISTTIELKAGIVGVVIPLRGMAQLSFSCNLQMIQNDQQQQGSSSSISKNKQTQWNSKQTLHVSSALRVPHIIQFDESTIDTYKSLYIQFLRKRQSNYKIKSNEIEQEIVDKLKSSGLLLSRYFTVNLQNIDSKTLTVELELESSINSLTHIHESSQTMKLGVRLARHIQHRKDDIINRNNAFNIKEKQQQKRQETSRQRSAGNDVIAIAPGQNRAISLEIYGEVSNSNNHNSLHKSLSSDISEKELNELLSSYIFLPCRRTADSGSSTGHSTNQDLNLVFLPSRGQKVTTSLEFLCRKMTESFLVSFLDHDDSVTQAGVVLPLPPPVSPVHLTRAKSSTESSSTKMNTKSNGHRDGDTCNVDNQGTCTHGDSFRITTKELYPYMLTLHGTGLTAISQADAYKEMRRGSSQYIFGVENLFIIAPSRHGAHNWENVGDLSARHSVTAVRNILSYYPTILPQVSHTPGLIAGHSMGGHGAWLVAVNAPDLALCVSPAAGWIRKEEYAKSNSFFELDIQNTYVSLSLKNVLESAMSEFHVDRLAPSNLLTHDVYIRVGSADISTPPWFSRRMYRVLKLAGINVTLEEVSGKDHWWWDTISANDGGALNDIKMRRFYNHCRRRHDAEAALTAAVQGSVTVESPKALEIKTDTITSNVGTIPLTAATVSSEANANANINSIRCRQDILRIFAINIGMNDGLCGIRITQQEVYMTESKVDISCHYVNMDTLSSPSSDNEGTSLSNWQHVQESWSDSEEYLYTNRFKQFGEYSYCIIKVQNVRRLSLNYKHFIRLFDRHSVVRIGGETFDLRETLLNQTNNESISICWANFKPSICSNSSTTSFDNFLPYLQRVPITAGPIRHVYSRPFHIIYGTPSDKKLRHFLQDFAVYLANSHKAAHSTQVKVMSDIEYRGNRYIYENNLKNIIFVGGPDHNKIFHKYCIHTSSNGIELDAKFAPDGIYCRTPVKFRFENEVSDASSATTLPPVEHTSGFQIGALHGFTNEDAAVIFTLPIYRRSDNTHEMHNSEFAEQNTAYAMCLHASTVEGYMSLARLAWPVVPPMVRSPFTNYLPDFVVLSTPSSNTHSALKSKANKMQNQNQNTVIYEETSVWLRGFGASPLAGYWNATWGFEH